MPVTRESGVVTQVGLGFCAEDQDVVVVELHFHPNFEAAVARAVRDVLG